MNSLMDIIYIPFGWLMGVFYNWTGNYAVALLLFAVVVNLLMLPFGIKQHKNMIKGAKLRPKTMAIEKKYAGKTDQVSMQKKQEEIMELNRSAGYSPFSGCLPMLLQMPIIIALFRIIRNPLTYILSVGDDAITTLIKKVNEAVVALGNTPLYQNLEKLDIRNMDQIKLVSEIKQYGLEAEALGAFELDALPNFTIFGGAIDLSAAPQSDFWSWLLLVPIISAALSFAQMKLSRKLNPTLSAGAQTREVRMSNVMMDLTMPLMSLWISYITSAAIGVYWIYRSILSMIQTVVLAFVMPMPKFTEEDYAAAEREMRPGKKKNSRAIPTARPGTERPRSLHHIDDDDELPYELKPRPNNNKNYHNQSKKKKNNNYKPNPANKPKPAPAPAAPAPAPAAEQKPNTSAASGIESAPLKDDNDR